MYNFLIDIFWEILSFLAQRSSKFYGHEPHGTNLNTSNE